MVETVETGTGITVGESRPSVKYTLIEDIEASKDAIVHIGKFPTVAFDTETTMRDNFVHSPYSIHSKGTGRNYKEFPVPFDPYSARPRLSQYCTPDNKIFLVDHNKVPIEMFKDLLESGIEVIGHNCFPSDALVTLADGSKISIGELVKKRTPVEVLSYNETTHTVEPKRVINWFDNGPNEDWVQVITEARRWITCTPDHQIFTVNRGWVDAGELIQGDMLISDECDLNRKQRSLIYGSLLGDMSIIKDQGDNSRPYIQVAHAGQYEHSRGYLLHKKSILDNIISGGVREIKNNRGFSRNNEGATLVAVHTKRTHLLNNIYKTVCPTSSKKEINLQWLEKIDPCALAYWYLDDGHLECPSRNKPYPRLAFCHNEEALLMVLEWFSESYSMHPTVTSRTEKIHYLSFYKDSDKFFNLIKEYVPNCMNYKLPEEYRGFYLEESYEQTQATVTVVKIQHTNDPPGSKTSVRERKTTLPTKNRKYCIEVEDNHNFFANGVLVSNCAFDYRMLLPYNIRIKKVLCTMLGMKCLEAGIKTEMGLAPILKRTMGITLSKEEQASDWSGDLTDSQLTYAALDTLYLHKLRNGIMNTAKKEDLLNTIYLEMSCIHPFANMVYEGLYLNKELCTDITVELSEQLQQYISNITQIALENGLDFDEKFMNSPKQLLAGFHKLGLDPRDFSEKPSTSKEALGRIAHPLAEELLKYKKLQKLVSTFLLPLPSMIHPITKCIHASIFQYGTDTGRPTSNSPNLLTIPSGGDGKIIRKCFTAPPGKMMVLADYDQVEVKLSAILSRDPNLCKVLKTEGADIHSETAKMIFGVDESTPDFKDKYRKPAKGATFLALYQGGADKLYATLGGAVPMKTCEYTINRLKEVYSTMFGYFDEVKANTLGMLREDRRPESRDVIGRRRLYDCTGDNIHAIGRQAANQVIQSTSASITKAAMVECHKAGLDIRLNVYDEILCYSEPDQAEQHAYLLEQCMRKGAEKVLEIGVKRGLELDLEVPITCKAEVVNSWYEKG